MSNMGNQQSTMKNKKQEDDSKMNQNKGDKIKEIIDKNVPEEMKQQANEMKKEVEKTLSQTQQQIQQTVKEVKQQLKSENIRPWLKEQQITSVEYWNDLLKQSSLNKGILLGLLLTNFVLPLFFMNRAEGIVTFCCYICVSILSHFLYQMAPQSSPNRFFTSTFSHLLWVPLLFWLATRSSKFDLVSSKTEMEHVDVTVSLLLRKGFFFTTWIRSVLTLNAIVLTLDGIKLSQILQQKSGGARLRGQQQQLPKNVSSGDRHQLIGENEGSNEDRQRAFEREQEGIKQRLRTNVTAPTA